MKIILFLLLSCVIGMRETHADDFFNRFTNVYFNPHKYIIGDFYNNRKNWVTSHLGSILFKNQDLPRENARSNNDFVILIWKYWDWLKQRHVRNFGLRKDPLDDCSVRNCKFVGTEDFLENADAVVVHLHYGFIPMALNRNPKQRWVFLTDESPKNTFGLSKNPPKLSKLANVFNWSMTYRSDSDVPVPYGRTLPRRTPLFSKLNYEDVVSLVPYWSKKKGHALAAVLMSNCYVKHRMNFLKELRKHISIDIYGKCSNTSKNSCPGYFRKDCEKTSQYLFYLVLENSMCSQYLSEKSFHHAYSKGAIPVIQGQLLENCKKLLPPNSYLHVDNYTTVKSLAKAMIDIKNNRETLLSYHFWRNNFEVLNEHGYFGTRSYHLCRLCEAMNYNDGKKKVYSEDDLRLFLDPKILCYKVDHRV